MCFVLVEFERIVVKFVCCGCCSKSCVYISFMFICLHMFAVCRCIDAAADHMIAALKPERSARARKRDVPRAVGLLRQLQKAASSRSTNYLRTHGGSWSWTRARFVSSASCLVALFGFPAWAQAILTIYCNRHPFASSQWHC